jgi:hypothetical protein
MQNSVKSFLQHLESSHAHTTTFFLCETDHPFMQIFLFSCRLFTREKTKNLHNFICEWCEKKGVEARSFCSERQKEIFLMQFATHVDDCLEMHFPHSSHMNSFCIWSHKELICRQMSSNPRQGNFNKKDIFLFLWIKSNSTTKKIVEHQMHLKEENKTAFCGGNRPKKIKKWKYETKTRF